MPIKTICLVSSLLGIVAFFDRPAAPVKEAAPAGSAATNKFDGQPRSGTTYSSIVQSASGTQNINVNGAQHDVRIKYNSVASGMPVDSPEYKLPVVPSSVPTGSTIQISQGTQNANISHVGGHVDIQYGPAVATNTGTSPERQ